MRHFPKLPLAFLIAAFLAAAPLAVVAQQTGIPISQLPQAALPLTGTETIPLVQNGFTRQTPASSLLAISVPPRPSTLGGIFLSSAPAGEYAIGVDQNGNILYSALIGNLAGHASLDLAITNNLSDLASATTARTNLGLGNLATQNAGTGLANSGTALNLQPAQATTIGGVESITSAAHNWVAYIDTSGVPHQSQPSFSDISGSITPAQCPTATVSVMGCVKPDGTTITISGGKISATGAVAGSIDAGGATNITNGTNGGILFENGGKVGKSAAIVSGDVVTGGGTNAPADSGVLLASLASLTTANQTLSGGANITVAALSTGSVTINCGANPGQYIANTGAFTIAAPLNDGLCDVQIENGVGAGTVTFSGFSEGTNTGDALDTVSGHKFLVGVTRIHGTSHYLISAMQ